MSSRRLLPVALLSLWNPLEKQDRYVLSISPRLPLLSRLDHFHFPLLHRLVLLSLLLLRPFDSGDKEDVKKETAFLREFCSNEMFSGGVSSSAQPS